MIDYARAQRLFRAYKGKLTRAKNKGDNTAIIQLWADMQRDFDAINAPLPDDWSRFQRAADDAYFAIQREQGAGHFRGL